tara:strand:+ start:381 stop:521 length:141 start_codon:yes stop_codon:yes gene_type:complete
MLRDKLRKSDSIRRAGDSRPDIAVAKFRISDSAPPPVAAAVAVDPR